MMRDELLIGECGLLEEETDNGSPLSPRVDPRDVVAGDLRASFERHFDNRMRAKREARSALWRARKRRGGP